MKRPLRNIASSVLTVTLLSISTVGYAQTAVHLGGWSHHIITDGLNSSHNAVMIEQGDWLVGRFTNSYDQPTSAIAYGQTWEKGNWKVSVHGGLVYGYSDCYSDKGDGRTWCPMVYPSLSYTKHRVQPTVGLIGEAFVLTIRVDLGDIL